MTKDNVVQAAFRVWGEELYKTTSLAKLAERLHVSKPALYRHFSGKQALLNAMEECFYCSYAAAIRPVIEELKKAGSQQKKLLALIQFTASFFARHFDYFLYSLNRLHGNDQHFFSMEEMNKRGIFFVGLEHRSSQDHPSALFLAGITALFGTGSFHKHRNGIENPLIKNRKKTLDESWFSQASEEDINRFSAAITERIRLGLLFDRKIIDTLPYEKLENMEGNSYDPPNPLLKAAAETVAEEGPWNTSMETVAKRSGLSKSGLYAHFKSKNDMLSRLFMTEFERIAQCAVVRTALVKTKEERLYLAILSIADYLQDRPEILVMLDWSRIHRLELDLSVPGELHTVFSGINLNVSIEGEKILANLSQWVLFLLVSVLMKPRQQKNAGNGFRINAGSPPGKVNRESLRKVFRFICLGLEGLGPDD